MIEKPKFELVEAAISDDPFDLAKLRINPENLEGAAVKKLLTTVPVRKPGKQDFIRVHPSAQFRETFAFLDLREDQETFIVHPAAMSELQGDIYVATLFTAITRSGTLFMWPVRVPAADGRVSDWHTSAAAAAQHAMARWVRVKANLPLGAYEIFEAESTIPDPIWPDLSFDQIYRIAFRDRLIADPDHAVLKRLRGG